MKLKGQEVVPNDLIKPAYKNNRVTIDEAKELAKCALDVRKYINKDDVIPEGWVLGIGKRKK